MSSSETGAMTEAGLHWRDDAACLDQDSEMFFATARDGASGLAQAKAVCGRCPVRQPCLDDALRSEGTRVRLNRFGLRGGVTGGSRWLLYDTARKAALETAA